jgi:signal transduction histidine kinase
MTALYSALFLATGGTMVAIVYLLQSRAVDSKPWLVVVDKATLRSVGGSGYSGRLHGPVPPGQLTSDIAASHSSSLLHLLVISVTAIAALALVGVLVGWWLAGRVLRPLRRITATARRLSSRNLHERIALPGPADELRELADTFDGMLARLERAFDSQRKFIANVSHELRTPLAVQRTVLELGLSSPDAEDVARVRDELLEANHRTEHLIGGLLSLARSDCGLERAEPVPLDALAREVADSFRQSAAAAGVRIELDTQPTTVTGDRVLLTQLVTNLVQNAVRHNHRDGDVRVIVSPDAGLRVCNTGPVVPEERVDGLFEPFVRLASPRAGADGSDGAGLGLSIVRAICRAHGTSVSASARPGGGLDIRIPLPGPAGLAALTFALTFALGDTGTRHPGRRGRR